jgi:hypothetical protein
MAGRTERHQPVEIEVRAPLGALDDVVDSTSSRRRGGIWRARDELLPCGEELFHEPPSM